MPLRDRMLRGHIVIGAIGPVVEADREAYVNALTMMAGVGPRARVTLRSRSHDSHWYFDTFGVEKRCEELVTILPPANADTIEALALAQSSRVTAEHPLHFCIAGNYVIQVSDHMLGDGTGFLDRLATIVQMASGNRSYPGWLILDLERFPLWKALRHTFFRNKKRRQELFASRRADRQVQHEEVHPGAATTPWHPQLDAAYVAVPPLKLQEIRDWVRRSSRSVTVSSALLVILRGAMLASGIVLQQDQTIIYDVRRYLPVGIGLVNGNFVTGLPLRVEDPEDPKLVGEAMESQIASGRPLAALAMGVGRFYAPVRKHSESNVCSNSPAVHMVFNNIGAARQLTQLPWTADPEERTCTLIVQTESPEHITITALVVAGVLHITASFHSNVFDKSLVEKALQSVARAPLTWVRSGDA